MRRGAIVSGRAEAPTRPNSAKESVRSSSSCGCSSGWRVVVLLSKGDEEVVNTAKAATPSSET